MPAVVLEGGTIFSTRTLLSVGISRFAISLFRNTIYYYNNRIKLLIRVLVSTLNIQLGDLGFVLLRFKYRNGFRIVVEGSRPLGFRVYAYRLSFRPILVGRVMSCMGLYQALLEQVPFYSFYISFYISFILYTFLCV